MRTLFASLLLILPSLSRAETALSQLGDAGRDIQTQAGALTRQVAARNAVDAKLDRATAMPQAPSYTEEKIEQLKAKLKAKLDQNPVPWRARVLRTELADLENKVESRFEDGGSCQETLDDALSAHRRYAELAEREMTAVHSEQLDTVQEVVRKIREEHGDAGTMLSALALDRKLLSALRARAGEKGGDAVRNVQASLESQGLDSVLKLAAAEVKAGAANVAAAEAAAGLQRVEATAPILGWELHQGEDAYLRACTGLLRSSQELPPRENPEAFGYRTEGRKYYVQYESCVDISLDSGAVKAVGLQEALSYRWGTADVVRLDEARYVNAAAGNCLELEAARRAYTELR